MTRAARGLLLAVTLGAAGPLAAAAAGAQSPPGRVGTDSSGRLFTKGDLVFYGTLGAATAVLWQFDDDIQDYVVDTAHRNATLDDVSIALRKVNERSAFAASLLTFVVGKVAGKPRVAEVGWHAAEGVFAAAGVQTLIKNAFGRSRPFVSVAATGKHDQTDLHPGRGFKDPWYRSMPSLHTGGMVAMVAVMTSEIDRWHPGSMRYVRPAAYVVAISPGVARMYDDRHWASDVLVGTATGYWAAKKVLRYHHPPGDPERRRRFDRWILGTVDVTPAPDGGVRVGVSADF